MGLFKTLKNTIGFLSSSKANKNLRNDKDRVYQLVLNNQILDINIRNVKTFAQKLNSIIFKEKINHDTGFRFINAKAFNSFGLRENVDLIFCNRRHEVIETYSNFPPNKATEHHENGSVLFLLAKNTNKYLKIKLKDIMKITK
ncbi:hypothetical protein SHELI_v1c03280 [Spiroplasma helicoides]|uniref:Uncharacterized protein n=1 Tax=Spiroplasma helicoides TaxID=216938 RepID=A0A1B3SK22_9MOLU|nr:hypothetical protein [Spiroplasma helicoides]AOG60283.1 hypothetical protein SHELI_v1c03280 [Spiroplasma helicoides]